MPTAAELLASKVTGDKTLVIDNDLRTIKIPSSITNLGVEKDDEVLRLEFRMPRYLGETDLSTFSVRINYLNANGQGDVYTVDDVKIVGDNLTFSWLVGPTATAYKGDTKFNVCMKIVDSDSYIQKEYNTTIATLPVLEGLETEERLVEYYSDILEQWKNQLFGIGDTEEANLTAKSEEEQENIAQKGIEVLATIPEDYQTTYEMANNAYRTRANAIVSTEQGEVISLTDSSNDPLRGLRIFGKTTQITTTGKNLLPTKNGAYGLRNGLTFTDLGDGRVNIIGTATANTTFVYCPFDVNTRTPIPAGTYTVSGSPGSNVYLSFFVYASQETTDILTNNASICRGNSWTFTIDQDAYYGAYLYIGSGKTANETISAQLEIGSVATDYEPYSGGIASPSPEWAQDLVSVENPKIDVYGKNLIQNTLGNATNSGITYTLNADGSITLDGTATDNSYYTFDFNNPIPAYDTELILSLEGGAGLTSITLGYFKHDSSVVNTLVYAEDSSVSFEYPSEAYSTRTFLTVTAGKTCDNLVVRPMVRLAETDSSFDASKITQTMTLPYTLPAIPVSSDGNYTDANGQQWICDEIDFERGVYVQRIKTLVLDGSNHMPYYGAHSNGQNYCAFYPGDVANSSRMLSDAYGSSAINWGNINNYIYCTNSAIVVLDNRFTDANKACEILAEELPTIQYILATPIETELTAEELVTFGAIHSNYPNTTILNDAGAGMEVKYNEDLKFYANEIMEDAANVVITQDKIQVAVDNWLSAHYSSAEGVSF